MQNGWKMLVRFESRKIWFGSNEKNEVEWKKWPFFEKDVGWFIS